MKFHGFESNKSLSEFRASPYHQQLGRKLCAAFIAQQQGTRLDMAHNKVEEPVGDLWLVTEATSKAEPGCTSSAKSAKARNVCSARPTAEIHTVFGE